MNSSCGCCEGVRQIVPEDTSNRPGLSTIRYRIGTHSSFLETMKARLANFPLVQEAIEHCLDSEVSVPLAGLRTRDAADPAIALLDAWALVADVLTFYQERIANEGYLRTATERLSVVELARLIGYQPRPGVAASVYLAYTLEKDHVVDIVAGSRAQSVPGPGELPQSFETSTLLKARETWNDLSPRTTRPQKLVPDVEVIYVKGTTTNLKANDRLLFDFQTSQQVRRIVLVEPDSDKKWTKITLEPVNGKPGERPSPAARATLLQVLGKLIEPLSRPPAQHPADPLLLQRSVESAFSSTSDVLPRALAALRPDIGPLLYVGLENAVVSTSQQVNVFAFRARASAFGHNAPKHQNFGDGNRILEPSEWPLQVPVPPPFTRTSDGPAVGGSGVESPKGPHPTESPDKISLDAVYDKVLAGSWIYLERPKPDSGAQFTLLSHVHAPVERSRADYGITAKVTEISLDRDLKPQWIDPKTDDLGQVRNVAVFGQSEELELADEPIEDPITGARIELDRIYPGLESGRWLIVSGERTDVPGTSDIKDAELVMLAGSSLETNPDLPGDSLHTFIELASGGLTYGYKPDSVKIYGNVVPATNGETKNEVLGNGDGAQALQSFRLRQSPLTYVSAVTPSGVESTLQIRVNDILWHEAEQTAALGPNHRSFVTTTDDDSKTTVIFGSGVRGARVPTGVENIKATYRTGIGSGGNVDAERITLLSTKPLGVKEVINPLRSSGGADRETRDQARHNAPVAVMSLDRLVSVQDYADFAHSFAGVSKANAVQIGFRGSEIVHVSIAGGEDTPIDPSSDLFQNLVTAFLRFGDPQQPVQLAVAEAMLLIIHAAIAILPDYEFESVAPKVRVALLKEFAFDNYGLGQGIAQSEVVSTVQNVEGVSYVKLVTLGAPPLNNFGAPASGQVPMLIPVNLARLDSDGKNILPAQFAFLTTKVPETLIVTELNHD